MSSSNRETINRVNSSAQNYPLTHKTIAKNQKRGQNEDKNIQMNDTFENYNELPMTYADPKPK